GGARGRAGGGGGLPAGLATARVGGEREVAAERSGLLTVRVPVEFAIDDAQYRAAATRLAVHLDRVAERRLSFATRASRFPTARGVNPPAPLWAVMTSTQSPFLRLMGVGFREFNLAQISYPGTPDRKRYDRSI